MINKKAAGTDYVPYYETSPRKRVYEVEENIKKNKKKKNKSWLVRISPQIGLILLFFIICFSFVAQNVWLNGLGSEVVILNQKIEDTKIHNEKLKLDIASLTCLDKIEESALEIGMVYPDANDYVYVEKANTLEMDKTIKYPIKEDGEEKFMENVQKLVFNTFNKAD